MKKIIFSIFVLVPTLPLLGTRAGIEALKRAKTLTAANVTAAKSGFRQDLARLKEIKSIIERKGVQQRQKVSRLYNQLVQQIAQLERTAAAAPARAPAVARRAVPSAPPRPSRPAVAPPPSRPARPAYERPIAAEQRREHKAELEVKTGAAPTAPALQPKVDEFIKKIQRKINELSAFQRVLAQPNAKPPSRETINAIRSEFNTTFLPEELSYRSDEIASRAIYPVMQKLANKIRAVEVRAEILRVQNWKNEVKAVILRFKTDYFNYVTRIKLSIPEIENLKANLDAEYKRNRDKLLEQQREAYPDRPTPELRRDAERIMQEYDDVYQNTKRTINNKLMAMKDLADSERAEQKERADRARQEAARTQERIRQERIRQEQIRQEQIREARAFDIAEQKRLRQEREASRERSREAEEAERQRRMEEGNPRVRLVIERALRKISQQRRGTGGLTRDALKELGEWIRGKSPAELQLASGIAAEAMEEAIDASNEAEHALWFNIGDEIRKALLAARSIRMEQPD